MEVSERFMQTQEGKCHRHLHAEARHKLEGCQVQHELLFEWEQQHFWPQLWFEQKRREKMRCLLSSYYFQINHLKREIFLHLRFNADDCFSLFVGINPKVDISDDFFCETHAQRMVDSDRVRERKALMEVRFKTGKPVIGKSSHLH